MKCRIYLAVIYDADKARKGKTPNPYVELFKDEDTLDLTLASRVAKGEPLTWEVQSVEFDSREYVMPLPVKTKETDFYIEYPAEPSYEEITYHYWSCNGRFYRQVKAGSTIHRTKRISESEMISAIETYHNA